MKKEPVELIVSRWIGRVELRCETRPTQNGGETRCLTLMGFRGVEYNPLELAAEEEKLFLQFATLDPANEDALLAFARQFGLLGGPILWVADQDAADRRVPAEPIDLWAREISAMRAARDLWGATTGDSIKLRRWITIQDTSDGQWVAMYERDDLPVRMSALIASSFNYAPVPRRYDWLARQQLDALVNERLDEHTSSQLMYVDRDRRSRFRIYPRDLLGAMWTQLAQAIDGNVEIRKCKWRQCQKWFQISHEQTGRTARAQYCLDPKHRVYEQRARQRDIAMRKEQSHAGRRLRSKK